MAAVQRGRHSGIRARQNSTSPGPACALCQQAEADDGERGVSAEEDKASTAAKFHLCPFGVAKHNPVGCQPRHMCTDAGPSGRDGRSVSSVDQ